MRWTVVALFNSFICCDALGLRGTCDESAVVLYQKPDAACKMVVNVIARGNERSLVLSNATDTTRPCKLEWWLSHEVQGTALCAEESPTASPTAFAQTPTDSLQCPQCTANVDDIRSGYLRSIAALSVSGLDGAPRNPGHVLVIGLGAGILPAWLHARTKAVVDVVDFSEVVVAAAPCFGVNTDERMRLHIADGRAFLEKSSTTYDTIVVDAFDAAAAMAGGMQTTNFFALVRKRLSDDGVMLLNWLTCGSDQDVNSCGRFRTDVLAAAQTAFPTLYEAQAPGSAGSQSVLVGPVPGVANGPAAAAAADGGLVQQWLRAAHVQQLKQVDTHNARQDA
jgi:SAM-dependent methyltransferase